MRPGDVIQERFEIEGLAAAGGMGQVFRALDRRSGRPVAIKVLLGGQGEDAERFTREIRVLTQLSHPAIVRYIDHGVFPAHGPYLVMEWLAGEDLASRLTRSTLTVGESLALGRQVAAALAAAHAQGIIHRDLKPRNLFLVDQQVAQVRLLDFGVAQARGASRVTQGGMLVGTPGYMAPEQARSERPIDERVDIYALGCVLFECLTGQPAFRGPHLVAMLAKILFEEAPRLCDLCPELPGELDALLGRMMAKDPEARPRSAAALLEELEGLEALAAARPLEDEAQGRARVLTRGEQRMLSVLLVAAEHPPGAGAEGADALAEAGFDGRVAQAAERFGGLLEHLADGSLAVTLAGEGVATDEAARAARCALAIAPHCRGRSMSLATGLGRMTGRGPLSEVIDRAAALLSAGPPTDTATAAAAPSPSEEGAGPIAIDEVTAGLLDARFDLREGDRGTLLYGMQEFAEGARTLLGKPTSCVGRDRDLLALARVFDGCVEDSQAQAVLVFASAGMGKTRLANEFLHQLRRREAPLALWTSRGDALRGGVALGLLAQAIRSACDIRDGDPLEARRVQLAERVAAHVPPDERQRVTEFLGELAGVPFSDASSPPLRAARRDAQLMNEQLRAAWIAFLRAECSARPVVLVLDDLQWADPATLRFIDLALRELRELPWMVLGLARPESRQTLHRLWAGRAVEVIHLQPLGRRAAAQLVHQVLGESVGTDTMERLLAQADGNAFYLEELIRATTRQRGAALPESVVAMVQSRLAALGGEQRRVLRAASVFGEEFWPGGVALLTGTSERVARVRELLAELVEQELLVRRPASRVPGEDQFGFRHALLREGAYAMLTEEDRALGHRLAGEWLEQQGEPDPIVLAEHFQRGGAPERAGAHFLCAAMRAFVAGDGEVALAHAQRALDCGLPEDTRVELLGLLCLVHGWRIDWKGALPAIEEVLRLAAPGSTPWAHAVTIRLFASLSLGQGEMFMATAHLLKETAPLPGAAGPMVQALAGCVYALELAGQVELAKELHGRAIEFAAPLEAEDSLATGWVSYASAWHAIYVENDPWRGLVETEQGARHFRLAGHPRGVMVSYLYRALGLWLLGARAAAEEELGRIQHGGEELGDLISLWRLLRVNLLAERGALEEAHAMARQTVAIGRTRSQMEEGRGQWMLAEVLRLEGDLAAAAAAAEAASERLALLPLERIPVLATWARILLELGRPQEALTVAQEAVGRAQALGACGLSCSVRVHGIHAECLEAAGDHEAACAALATACERLQATARRIEDPGYRRSFLEDIPAHVRLRERARAWLGGAHARALEEGVQ